MDSVLLLGSRDPKLAKFLTKVGYQLTESRAGDELVETLGSEAFDIVVVDTELDLDRVELCSFLRENESTRHIPIVYLATKRADEIALRDKSFKNIEILDDDTSIGSLVSKIATQLRLRKFAGNDVNASLGQKNAMLRDLNERFQREIEEAREIQQNLLPKALPGDNRYQVAASYDPLEEVGGDWFFAKKEPSGKVSGHIADVTGHGLSAAFIGSMTKLALTAADCEEPHELLQEMNRLMSPQLPEGKFVTMFSYLYDPQSGQLSYARAGHNPALLLRRKSSEVTELKGDGFAVGFFPEAEYSKECDLLEAGDVLLLYTDGIVEAKNLKNELYGLERLAQSLLETESDWSVAKILEKILSDFEVFRDGRILKDDVTLLALKRAE